MLSDLKEVMKCNFMILLLVLSTNVASGQDVQLLATSPNGRYLVERRKGPMDESLAYIQHIDVVEKGTNHKVFSIQSFWRAAEAEWNRSGSLLYINDRVANSGDYLYILSLQSNTPVLLKKPNDRLFDELNNYYNIQSKTGHISVRGYQWLSNTELSIIVGGSGYGDDKTFTATLRCDPKAGAIIDWNSVKGFP